VSEENIMDTIIVGIIVAAAVFVTIKNFVKMFKSDSGCSCNVGCGSCSRQSDTEDFPVVPRK
jgi:attachment p12 family protein